MKKEDVPPNLIISDSHFDEQFPLAPIDDHMVHQTPDPIRVMWSSDPRTYERYWVICHDNAGDLIVVTGGSFYPSLDTAEAYAIVNYRGDHRSVRAFRRLGADRMNLHLGPLKPTIIQGMRLWRFVLDENDWGISYDFLWRDTKRQIYHASTLPTGSGYPRGRQSDITAGFEGFGAVEGWVKMDGHRIELTPETCGGTRDRHWGIGRGVGGPNPKEINFMPARVMLPTLPARSLTNACAPPDCWGRSRVTGEAMIAIFIASIRPSRAGNAAKFTLRPGAGNGSAVPASRALRSPMSCSA